MPTIDSFAGEHAFLSNFYPSVIHLDGWAYPTVEHYFQSSKADSAEERSLVLESPTPGGAKRRGRSILLRPDWEDIKVEIMFRGVAAKFIQNRELLSRLLATAPNQLVEGNTWGDDIWGCVKTTEGRWEGQNLLGTILMAVRDSSRYFVARAER
jgi:ribA/ribD-fused uncharacterized protein